MIDGFIDLYGTPEEAVDWFNKFIEDFKKKKPVKGMIYRFYMGVAMIPEVELTRTLKKNKSTKLLNELDELEEDIDSEVPARPHSKSLRIREGYA